MRNICVYIGAIAESNSERRLSERPWVELVSLVSSTMLAQVSYSQIIIAFLIDNEFYFVAILETY